MKKTYQGSCHCGQVKFEVDADIDHVRVCDCTVCTKRSALNFRVENDDLRAITQIEDMTLYQWNKKIAKDYFCPTCGILPYRRPRTSPDIWTVNVRCLDGIDIGSLPVEPVYGAQLD